MGLDLRGIVAAIALVQPMYVLVESLNLFPMHLAVYRRSRGPRFNKFFLLVILDSSSKYNLHNHSGSRPTESKRLKSLASEYPVNLQGNKVFFGSNANVLITIGKKGCREYGAHVELECADRDAWRMFQPGSPCCFDEEHSCPWGSHDKGIELNDTGVEVPFLHNSDCFWQVETDAEVAMLGCTGNKSLRIYGKMLKSSRKKEEERIEKIIRNLLKLPENRRCINCTCLGPQYVCTTFWTFVCMNCSGVHREFTHRVKSVSMAKFSAEEVSALEAGGNERAREIYFQAWDPQRHVNPDGSNQNKLRDFIRQVYVDRKYAGESTTKLALTQSDSKEEPSRRRSIDSTSYEGRPTDSGSRQHVDERSSQNKQGTVKSRARPARFEIVDNRFRDDGFDRRRCSDAHKVNNVTNKSPVAEKIQEKMSSPAMQVVAKDILGEDIPPLRVDDPQEKSPPSSVTSPVDVKPPEDKREKSVSLIDFMADESSDPTAAPQTQETAIGANDGSVKSQGMGNSSSAPQVNFLELMLFDLSDPAPAQVSGHVAIPNAGPVVGDVHEQSATSGATSTSTQQVILSPEASYDQVWSSSPAPNTQNCSSTSVIEPNQPGLNAALDITSQTEPQASSVEANSRGRGELQMDLFNGGYPSFQAPVQYWQFQQPHGTGYNMYQHYPPNPMPGPSVPHLAKSRNPFDLNDDITPTQTALYPSMLPVQDGVSNFPAHHALLSASGANQIQFMQSQPLPYQAMPPTQIPTYGMSPVPGAFAAHQMPYDMPHYGSQGDKGVGTEQQDDPFAALSPIQPRHGGPAVPSTENSLPSAEGNPFR